MRKETKIGILAVLALVGFIWGYKFLKGQNLFSSAQVFYAVYSNVDNLPTSSPVLINGLEVGMVTRQFLDENHPDRIIIEFDVLKEIHVPKSTVAVMQTTSFMGGKSINLMFKGVCIDDCAESGDTLISDYAGLLETMLPPELVKDYVVVLRDNIGGLMDSVGAKLQSDDNQAGRAINDLTETIENLKSITGKVDMLVDGVARGLIGTSNNLNNVSGNLKENNEKINAILTNAEAFTEDLKQAELGKTVDGANYALVSLQESLEEVKKAAVSLEAIMANINNGNGTMGKLIKDPTLYTNLERTSKNLDLLLQDLRLNPKRYVNVSVFGKKQKEYNLPENDPAFRQNDSIKAPDPKL
jgi:phospholipid/cholesterol/gamma-HCH transport system substrate-binding protein